MRNSPPCLSVWLILALAFDEEDCNRLLSLLSPKSLEALSQTMVVFFLNKNSASGFQNEFCLFKIHTTLRFYCASSSRQQLTSSSGTPGECGDGQVMVPVPYRVPNGAGERGDTVTAKGETFHQGRLSEEL